jgi:hypothetical protein
MKTIRTDADVMKIANKIDDLSWQIQDLIALIGDSSHPNAADLKEALEEQCCFFAWANHVAHNHLKNPDQWDCDKMEDGGHLRYKHVAAHQAARTRFKNKIEKRKREAERLQTRK